MKMTQLSWATFSGAKKGENSPSISFRFDRLLLSYWTLFGLSLTKFSEVTEKTQGEACFGTQQKNRRPLDALQVIG